MHRNHLPGAREAVQHGLSFYPEPVRQLLMSNRACHISTGIDPGFVGLHSHDKDGRVGDGRAYKDTAHVSFPWNTHVNDEMPIMVLPYLRTSTIIHEFAHVIDFLLGFPQRPKSFTAVNEYAETSTHECLAEAMLVHIAASASAAQNEAWILEGRWWQTVRELTRDDSAYLDSILERVALL